MSSQSPPLSIASSKRSDTLRGILILVFATFFFAAQDAITKKLTQSVSVYEIVCIRFFFFSLFAIVYTARNTKLSEALKSQVPVLQIIRALLISGEIAIFAYAVRFLGLAELHAMFACFPLLITALSVPFLKEQVGWRRWVAIFVGFIGTLIIIRPGTGVFEPVAMLALVCALMFAMYNILTRKVSRYDSFQTSLLYFGLVGFFVSLLTMPWFWETPTNEEALWLLAISAVAIIGHIGLIKALELAPAVILQPFNYFVLIWAICIGYFAFGEILDTMTLLGAVIVVSSGVFVAYREYRIASIQHREPS